MTAAALCQVLPGATSATAATVTATIPNVFVRVYACSELGTRCTYRSMYQVNPPFDPSAPDAFMKKEIVAGGRCGHDCRDPLGRRRGRART